MRLLGGVHCNAQEDSCTKIARLPPATDDADLIRLVDHVLAWASIPTEWCQGKGGGGGRGCLMSVLVAILCISLSLTL